MHTCVVFDAYVFITKQYENQFDVPNTDCYPLHTGEITLEKLRLINKKGRKVPLVSEVQREELEKEWQEFSSTQEVVRVWENKEIKSVE